MEYEYQNTMDVSKITQKISAALENVEEVTDAKAGIVETETEDSGESDGEEYQQGSWYNPMERLESKACRHGELEIWKIPPISAIKHAFFCCGSVYTCRI